MKNPARLALLALTVLATATACVPRAQQPEINLAGVRVGGLGLQGGLLYVRVGISNPNRFGLLSRSVTYDVEVVDPLANGEWVRLSEGNFTDPIQVGGRDSVMVEIPIEFRYNAVGGAIRSIMATGNFQYRISGRVRIEEPMLREIPFQHRGTLSIF